MNIWYRLTVIIDGRIDSIVDSNDYDLLLHIQQQLEQEGKCTKLTEQHSQ